MSDTCGMNPRIVTLPRSSPALELYDVYETIPKMFIIASDMNKTVFNILKIDRLASEELSLSEDTTNYTHVQIKMVVDTLRQAFTEKEHYFKFLTCGYGVMGFIRFTKGYNLVMITKRNKVAQLGPHAIYEVKGTEVRPLSNDRRSFSDEETRYHNLFTSFETKKDFYFSYTYDLSHSLQFNSQRHARGKLPERDVAYYDDMFVYNSFLLNEFQKELGDCNSKWVLPCIHGSLWQKTFDCNGRNLRLILIGRRSRYFAGTRFLKRGVSEEGNVANHIETEQIVFDASNLGKCGTLGWLSSHVQVRGSVPLYWYQPRLVEPTKLRPPIKLGRGDTWNSATKLHFAHLLSCYGTPVICLDLLKQKEKTPRESQLGREFSSVVEQLNDALPLEERIRYIGWDFRHASRVQEKVNNDMASIAEEAFSLTGMFTTGGTGVGTTEQTGVVRTNCVDCLDRTNLAQFFIGKYALFRQLEYLGMSSKTDIMPEYIQATDSLLELYLKMGDQIAMQYGGSKAVTLGMFNRGSWGDIATSVVRYCNNRFWDNKKQESLNIFLGNYTTYVSSLGEPDITRDSFDDQQAVDCNDPKALGQQYAFQRPVRYILHEDSIAGASVNPTIPAPPLSASQGVNSGLAYSFPVHTRSEQRLPNNASFSSQSGQPPDKRFDEYVSSPSISPGPGTAVVVAPAVPSGERRVIDLWDIENDHYLHVQGAAFGRATFAAPPMSLHTKWWEAPLAMFNARLMTTKRSPVRVGSFSGNSLFRCYLDLHQSDFAGSVCARYMNARGGVVGRFGVPQHTSFRTARFPRSPDSISFDNTLSRLAPPLMQQSPDPLFSSLKTVSDRLDRTEKSLVGVPLEPVGDAALAECYPSSQAKTISFFPEPAAGSDAGDDVQVLTDTAEGPDTTQAAYLEKLKLRIEGKFCGDAPFLWPVNRPMEGDSSESWRILSHTADTPRTDDIPTDNYTRYEDYCKLQLYYEQAALWILNGSWAPYLKEVRQSSYYRSKMDQEMKDAWMVTHTVRELVSGERGRENPERMFELEREYSDRSEFAPPSLTRYQQYAQQESDALRMSVLQSDTLTSPSSSRRAPEDPQEETLDTRYHDYVTGPKRVQEELCMIEAEALRHGTYSPEQDTGPVVAELNTVFAPFLENPVPDCKLEATMCDIVECMRQELEMGCRTRSVRSSWGAVTSRVKGSGSDVFAAQFKKCFLARQAIEYVLNNIPHLHLSPDHILSDKRPRDKAVDFLDLLLQAGVFRRILDADTNPTSSQFTDSFHMYRFMKDEGLRVLNMERGMTPLHLRVPLQMHVTPIELSKVLITKALYLFRAFEEGSDTDVVSYVQTPRYSDFAMLTQRLVAINLSLLATDQDKIAFWTNVYNALHIDAQFTIGGAFPVHQNVFLTTTCYQVGGYALSLDEIQHGILRGNRRAPVLWGRRGRRVTHRLFRPFAPDDPRRHLSVKEADNRVHFALLRLSSDDLLEGEFEETTRANRKGPSNTSFSLKTDASPKSGVHKAIDVSPKGTSLNSSMTKVPRDRTFHSDASLIDTSEGVSTEDSSSDEGYPVEPKQRTFATLEGLFAMTKRTAPKPAVNIVLGDGDLDAQLKETASQKLVWGVHVIADADSRELSLPDLFFTFPEDFGTTPEKIVGHVLPLVSGSSRKRLARFSQRQYHLRPLAVWRE